MVIIRTSDVIQRNFWWGSDQGQVMFDEISNPVFFVKSHIYDYEFSQDFKYAISFLLRLLELPELTNEEWRNAFSTIGNLL